VSARDTGAAAHLAEIVPSLKAATDIDLVLVADEPAFSHLDVRGLSPRKFTGGSIETRDAPGAKILRSAARRMIDEIKPHALLVGLSGLGLGIDEALLAEATALPTYAVQDYPGWVVEGFGIKPRTFFVTDNFAAEMTLSQLNGCRTVVTGSAKHAAYARLDPLALRSTGRARLRATGPRVVFYGQPAWFLTGYPRAIASFAEALTHCGEIALYFRPHPKETHAERTRMMTILSNCGLNPRFDPNDPVEQSLCAADLIVTCFSSCGADQVYLQKYSPEPLGTVLYLFTEADLRRHHAAHAGSDVPPFAIVELVLLAGEPATLATDLRRALDPATSRACWQRVQQMPPDLTSAANVVLATIREDLAQGTVARQPQDL
jgi:hypothetical protein